MALLIASARLFSVFDAGWIPVKTVPLACNVKEVAVLMLVFDGSATVPAPVTELVAVA